MPPSLWIQASSAKRTVPVVRFPCSTCKLCGQRRKVRVRSLCFRCWKINCFRSVRVQVANCSGKRKSTKSSAPWYDGSKGMEEGNDQSVDLSKVPLSLTAAPRERKKRALSVFESLYHKPNRTNLKLLSQSVVGATGCIALYAFALGLSNLR